MVLEQYSVCCMKLYVVFLKGLCCIQELMARPLFTEKKVHSGINNKDNDCDYFNCGCSCSVDLCLLSVRAEMVQLHESRSVKSLEE